MVKLKASVPDHVVTRSSPVDLQRFSHRLAMDAQEDAKATERATPTKFEKREWFLENLRLLLSFDLNQDPGDEGSRLEWLRLHSLELTVSDRALVGMGLILMASHPLIV